MTRDEYLEAELSKWRELWEGGHLFALYGAVQQCAVASEPLPDWVSIGVLNLIAERHFNPPPKVPKGGSRHTKKARDDLEHWRRWNTVRSLRCLDVPWSEIYDQAAMQLYGRVDQKGGGPDAVKASYLLVQKAREEKDPRYSFSIIDPGDLPSPG